MATRTRQLLLLFMVAWLPFCCCQTRAAVGAVAAVVHHVTSHDEVAAKDCCAHERCCETDSKSPADSCAHCTACKERALPAAAPTIDRDTVGTPDMLASLIAAVLPAETIRQPEHAGSAYDTGPPPRPHGRFALAMHARLVI